MSKVYLFFGGGYFELEGACASFGGYHFLRGGNLFQLEEGVHFSRRGSTSIGEGGTFQ